MKIVDLSYIEAIPLSLVDYPLFNDVISNNISQHKAIACCDASVSIGIMGGYWIITNNEKENEIKYRIFSKEWSENSPISTKAIVLLDLVEIAYRKSKHIKNCSIVLYNDNRKLIGVINYEELTKN